MLEEDGERYGSDGYGSAYAGGYGYFDAGNVFASASNEVYGVTGSGGACAIGLGLMPSVGPKGAAGNIKGPAGRKPELAKGPDHSTCQTLPRKQRPEMPAALLSFRKVFSKKFRLVEVGDGDADRSITKDRVWEPQRRRKRDEMKGEEARESVCPPKSRKRWKDADRAVISRSLALLRLDNGKGWAHAPDGAMEEAICVPSMRASCWTFLLINARRSTMRNQLSAVKVAGIADSCEDQLFASAESADCPMLVGPPKSLKAMAFWPGPGLGDCQARLKASPGQGCGGPYEFRHMAAFALDARTIPSTLLSRHRCGVRSRCGPVAKHEIRVLQLHVAASQCETMTLLVLGRWRDEVMLRPRERLCRSLRLGRYFPLRTQSRVLRRLKSLRAHPAGTRLQCECISTSPPTPPCSRPKYQRGPLPASLTCNRLPPPPAAPTAPHLAEVSFKEWQAREKIERVQVEVEEREQEREKQRALEREREREREKDPQD
ncbi:hypothetical protein C8R45DRAFT_931604 [Mycena sanguinolenta]|nr:hypothetical protein C8R45DRAFT_931604 [Mycena sanguinolenta]